MRLALGLVVLVVPLTIGCGSGSATPPSPDTSSVDAPVAEAIERARAAVYEDPGASDAWGDLGLVLDAHDFLAEAYVAYGRAEALLAPDSNDAGWAYLASFCVPNDDAGEIIAALERARVRSPRDRTVLARLGAKLLEVGRHAEARATFAVALEDSPDDARALIGSARALSALGDDERARRTLTRALEIAPDSRDALALFATLLGRAGDLEQARSVGERARSLPDPRPEPDPYRHQVAKAGVSAVHFAIRGDDLLRVGDFEGAVDAFVEALDLRPDRNDLRVSLGQALLLAGRANASLATLRSAVSIEPDAISPKRSLAAALAATGELEDSAKLCAEVLELAPGDHELRARYVAILRRLGRTAEADRVERSIR
jgi:Flp pilus assembly protein TadD